MRSSRGSRHTWQELLWVQVFSRGCKFSPVGASFLPWVQVFQLALAFDTMEISSPQETRWNRVATKKHDALVWPQGDTGI